MGISLNRLPFHQNIQSNLTFYVELRISIESTMILRLMRDYPTHWSGELVQSLNPELSSHVTFENIYILTKLPAAASEAYEKRLVITICIIASRGSVSRSRQDQLSRDT